MVTTPIKDFYGKILGWIVDYSNGDAEAKDFNGRILGRYNKQRNVTTDFYGRILTQGNTLSALILNH